jgi:hypothetical protein
MMPNRGSCRRSGNGMPAANFMPRRGANGGTLHPSRRFLVVSRMRRDGKTNKQSRQNNRPHRNLPLNVDCNAFRPEMFPLLGNDHSCCCKFARPGGVSKSVPCAAAKLKDQGVEVPANRHVRPLRPSRRRLPGIKVSIPNGAWRKRMSKKQPGDICPRRGHCFRDATVAKSHQARLGRGASPLGRSAARVGEGSCSCATRSMPER